MFYMFVSPSQISADDFINILTCFKCYAFEDHPTKECQVTDTRCSECAATGHRWNECQSTTKKCLNCSGPHRTLAMACPIKKEAVKKKREANETRKQDAQMRPYSDIVKKTVQQCQSPPPTQIILGNEQSYKVMTCVIHAHVVNLPFPSFILLRLSTLLPFILPNSFQNNFLFLFTSSLFLPSKLFAYFHFALIYTPFNLSLFFFII